MTDFHYVYLLVSEDRQHRYVGLTKNLKARLRKLNAGEVPHSAKYRPWILETAIAFKDKERAAAYERHLKTHAGREYAKRHF